MVSAQAAVTTRSLFAALAFAGAMIASAPPVAAAGDISVSVKSFVGCWLTAKPEPIVILGADSKPDDYQVFHEQMLLVIEPITDTQLVKGRYYALSPDLKSVIGPAYVDGAFNPVEGVLTVGEPKGGLNRVHLQSDDTILYVHTKAADTADMSVREMDRLDCDAAQSKEGELLAAQKADAD